MLVAINGIPGAGKSTICARLKELGLDAWDTDEDGLAPWRDRVTQLPVPAPAKWHDPVEIQTIEYRVIRERVEELRERAHDHTVYLCGCAGGEDEFWDVLDRAICVAVDEETLRHRLATRTANNYGKADHELASILEANKTWAEEYREFGAVVIDGTRSLDDVVADVIRIAEEMSPSKPAGTAGSSGGRSRRAVRTRLRGPPLPRYRADDLCGLA